MYRESLIKIIGEDSGTCGYCDGKNKYSFSTVSHEMKSESYTYLMDRGWRRCGVLFYKPLNDKCCCPQYTIRCDVKNFSLKRSQKRVLLNMENFLKNGTIENKKTSKEPMPVKVEVAPLFAASKPLLTLNAGDIAMDKKIPEAPKPVHKTLISPACGDTEEIVQPKLGKKQTCDSKAKYKRYMRRLEKLKKRSVAENVEYNVLYEDYLNRRKTRKEKFKPKDISYYIKSSDSSESFKNRIKLKLIKTDMKSPEFLSSFQESYEVYKQYQIAIHKDEEEELSIDRYQRFLVDSSLTDEASSDRPISKQYGTYHRQYWLNDTELIAVEVLDILPIGTSSVYFYYKLKYNFLRLGVYSALREIKILQDFQKEHGPLSPHPKAEYEDFHYYYMGFYVHSCQKMRYKASYRSSSLLCPETYNWFPIRECTKLLDMQTYARFSKSTDVDAKRLTMSVDEVENRLILRIKVTSDGGKYVPFSRVKQCFNRCDIILSWAFLVGELSLDGGLVLDFA